MQSAYYNHIEYLKENPEIESVTTTDRDTVFIIRYSPAAGMVNIEQEIEKMASVDFKLINVNFEARALIFELREPYY